MRGLERWIEANKEESQGLFILRKTDLSSQSDSRAGFPENFSKGCRKMCGVLICHQ